MRRTAALAAATLALVAVVVAEGLYLAGAPPFAEDATGSASRPIVIGEVAYEAAVDTAARSAAEILSTSYRDYDAQVDSAATRMTDSYARDYRRTAARVRDRFVDGRTEVQVDVVGKSVVRASPERVQALLFFDQYAERGGAPPAVVPYRALVTVVHTDRGWLVDGIDTR